MNTRSLRTATGEIPAPVTRVPSKIVELAQVAETLAPLRAAGACIVHCHGVFDLLHVGHIRHLREARALGDVLVVSITEDRLVNKGPHRPAFQENLRAEALAALADIDYVVISRFPTAVEAIRAVSPAFYVKGPDYKENSTDITGGISIEEQAVRDGGGSIFYTSAATFSSSHLLNRHFTAFTPEVEKYLAEFRTLYSAAEVIGHLDRIRALHVTVVGEAILDEYVYCEQMGKSSKDPVLAMRYESRELYAGGALAVANHVANFTAAVDLVTYLGTEDPREDFVRTHLHEQITPHFIYKKASPTIIKRRYVETYLRSKHFEVYYINDEPLIEEQEHELCVLLDAVVPRNDMIIAADFGHGLLGEKTISHLARGDKFLAVNTQINAANIRYHAISSYDRADYICINEKEVRLDARSRQGDLRALTRKLADRLRCRRILVTRGSRGVEYFEDDTHHAAPAVASSVVDRTGSGDAVLALTSLAAATGVPAPIVAFLANVIGAQKVQIIGNKAAVDRVATIKFIEALLK